MGSAFTPGDSVRTELSCRTPSGCWRAGRGVKSPMHLGSEKGPHRGSEEERGSTVIDPKFTPLFNKEGPISVP